MYNLRSNSTFRQYVTSTERSIASLYTNILYILGSILRYNLGSDKQSINQSINQSCITLHQCSLHSGLHTEVQSRLRFCPSAKYVTSTEPPIASLYTNILNILGSILRYNLSSDSARPPNPSHPQSFQLHHFTRIFFPF